MAEPTLNDIATTLNKVATNTANLVVDVSEIKTDLSEMKGELKEVKQTVNSHTGILDKVLSTTTKLDAERLVESDRIRRLESWAEQVGEKLGIKLEV